jgi:hypothetical protein
MSRMIIRTWTFIPHAISSKSRVGMDDDKHMDLLKHAYLQVAGYGRMIIRMWIVIPHVG